MAIVVFYNNNKRFCLSKLPAKYYLLTNPFLYYYMTR